MVIMFWNLTKNIINKKLNLEREMERTEIDDNLRSFLYKDFILPSNNPEALQHTLASRLVYGTNGNSEQYYKDVISFALAQLGVKKGVSYDTFNAPANDPIKGKFLGGANKIIADEVFLEKVPLAHSSIMLSHEAFHKHQYEINKHAKILSSRERSYTTSHDKKLLSLLGLTNNSMFYHITNSEKQAYVYDGIFISSLLTKAQELATFMRDPEKQAQIAESQKQIRDITSAEQNTTATYENMFISQHMPTFYNAANKTFNNLVSYFLDSQVNSKQELERSYSPLLKRLSTIIDDKNPTPEIAIYAMTKILGVLPKKENVETFIDAVTTSRNDVSEMALMGIVHNRVPITQGDFTRLALSSNLTGKEMPKMFEPKNLDGVEETAWVKNLVLTVGATEARNVIAQFKASGEMPNTDFDVVEKYASTFSDKPLLSVDGTPFYNCKDLLQYVSARESQKYARFGNNIIYYQTCGMLSKNLANVINHFNNPSADNEEFISALEGFVANPKAIQFSEKEERTEIGTTFTSTVSEKLAEFIGEVRAQHMEDHPNRTDYIPVETSSGKTYSQALVISAEQLSDSLLSLTQSIKQLTDTINKISVPVLLERLGVNNLVSVEGSEESPVMRISNSGIEQNEGQQETSGDIIVRVGDNNLAKTEFAPALTKEQIQAMINGSDSGYEMESLQTYGYSYQVENTLLEQANQGLQEETSFDSTTNHLSSADEVSSYGGYSEFNLPLQQEQYETPLQDFEFVTQQGEFGQDLDESQTTLQTMLQQKMQDGFTTQNGEGSFSPLDTTPLP